MDFNRFLELFFLCLNLSVTLSILRDPLIGSLDEDWEWERLCFSRWALNRDEKMLPASSGMISSVARTNSVGARRQLSSASISSQLGDVATVSSYRLLRKGQNFVCYDHNYAFIFCH